jgi:radical SAM superfamily enzyme YgiQ (UPF0313 family)
MRILLINPFYPISETPSPPLGLAYLAAVLERDGAEVKVLDLVVTPYRRAKLSRILADFRPDMVGSTAVTMNFNAAVRVLADVREIDSAPVIVMGGPHVSFCAAQALREHPQLDAIVCGEGERTLVELARAGRDSSGWRRIRGLVFRDGRRMVDTGPREAIRDLNSLPEPARHLLPLGRYRALRMPVSITTSRGCPYRCIFCVGRKMVGARVRYRDPARVVDELQQLATLGFHQINIADDLFTANRRHCLAVCNEIFRRRLKVTWTSFGRVDTVSEDVLRRMRRAGCAGISFGIESGNEGILKTIRKGINRRQVLEAIRMCRQVGIPAFASFILGLPGETPQTIAETLDFGEQLKKLGLAFGFHLLAPFPGTEVRDRADELGIRILSNDWSEYHANRAVVETPTVTRDMLNAIVVRWEDEYNQLLADIKARMQTGSAGREERLQLVNLERVVLAYDLMMKEIVETEGRWRHGGAPDSEEKVLQTLIERVGRRVEAAGELVAETLTAARRRRDLEWESHAGEIHWRWVEKLTSRNPSP